MTMPQVFVTVPGVEDLGTVIDMLRAAGATITHQRREFVITGPLTPEGASAVWWMSTYQDSGSEGNRLDVEVHPRGDLRAALDRMCPGGWSEDDFHPSGERSDEWWHEQQRIQVEMRRQPPPAIPPPVETGPPRRTDGTCCGQGGTWGPKEGQPVVVGCQLCPQSGTYWRPGRVAAQAS